MTNNLFFQKLKNLVENSDYIFWFDNAYIDEIDLDNKELWMSDNEVIKFDSFDIEYLITLVRKEMDSTLENLVKIKKEEIENTESFHKYIALNNENVIMFDIEELVFEGGLRYLRGLFSQHKVKNLPELIKLFNK